MVTDIEGEGGYEIKSEVGVCAMAVQPCSRSRIRRDLAVTDPMSASTGPILPFDLDRHPPWPYVAKAWKFPPSLMKVIFPTHLFVIC